MVRGRVHELWHRAFRVSLSGPSEPDRLRDNEPRAAQVLQEVITLALFAPFAVLYMHQGVRLNYLWAGLCLAGAVYFMFRS